MWLTDIITGISWATWAYRLPWIRGTLEKILQRSGGVTKEGQDMRRMIVHTDGFDGFRKRSLERARKLDRGELLEPQKILTFENALNTLTRARIGVYRKVKEKELLG